MRKAKHLFNALRIVTVSILWLTGCSTTSLTYKDLSLPSEINRDPEKLLNPEQVRYDLSQLKYALTHAYSGRRYLPGKEFPLLIERLDTISGGMTAIDLCRAVEAPLNDVSDSHLHAQLVKDRCKSTERTQGRVGSNFYRGEKVWHVESASKKGKKAILISIRSFPGHDSPEWNGFIDSVKSLLPGSDLVIIDMRGNDGGDDTLGKQLSDLLAGNDLKTPYATQWQSHTPENEQLAINSTQLYIKKAEKDHLDSGYLKKMERDQEEELASVLQGKRPTEITRSEDKGESFDQKKSVRKPIYILADRECVSSCESTIDFFEFNPLVKTVGENTGGFNHFGNNAHLVMKNSGVVVMMASTFNFYTDGRFIEKKGITPKIQVSAGRDAMNYAWNDYFSSNHKKSKSK